VTAKRALLKLDLSNAFNSCDRARVLQELYDTPELSALHRLADFGYSAPSALLLEGCEGLSILSSNGVRQGDPLSALLFCLYLRKPLEQLVGKTKVRVYAFFDDLNITGTPTQLKEALAELQRLLAPISLQCNTAKSHFAYFHAETAPLLRSAKETLATANIEMHERWIETVGAIVGKDEAAISEGITNMLEHDAGRDTFFYRLQLPQLKVQSAMLLLRQCAVPQLNYLLRCTPPSCIRQHAVTFDRLVLDAAHTKLVVHASEATARSIRLLRAPLRKGGYGLTSAEATSPAAYLGSLAAVSDIAALARYHLPDSLPADSMLHGWIASSILAVQEQVAPAPMDKVLQCTASCFISHYNASPATVRSSLQRSISKQAVDILHEASLRDAKNERHEDGGRALAHLHAISAPRAWSWKAVIPSTRELQLTDKEYQLAARHNLGLSSGYAQPSACPNCSARRSLDADPWHFLSCAKEKHGEMNMRHDAVASALYRTVLAVGGQAVREPTGMAAADGRRPDLRIVVGGRHIIADVVITNPLAPSHVKKSQATLSAARTFQQQKHRKYDTIAAQHGAHMLPFAVETTGGMAPDAVTLLHTIAQAGEEQLGLWPKEDVIEQLVSSVAVAVQKGNAMTYLAGYDRAMVGTIKKVSAGVRVGEE